MILATRNKAHRWLFVFFFILALQACGGGSSSSGGGSGNGDVSGNGDSSGGGTKDDDTTNEDKVVMRSIVTIGDSIGVGVGFGSTKPWPNVLANILSVPLLKNRSIASKRTDWGLSQIRGLLDKHKPTHVVILLGTNDARGGSVGAAIANLQQMANIANSKSVTPVIGTVIINKRSSSHDRLAKQISEGIRGIQGAIIADTRAAVGDGNGLIDDGIHPNNAGQQTIARAFADVF